MLDNLRNQASFQPDDEPASEEQEVQAEKDRRTGGDRRGVCPFKDMSEQEWFNLRFHYEGI